MFTSLISTKTSSSCTQELFYPAQLPTCSSSEPTFLSHDTVDGRTSLHSELIDKGLVDENGVITEKAKSSWRPIPLSSPQIARMKQLNALCVYEGISLQHCINFFKKMYGDAVDDLFLIGGAAIWVLGWEYYMEVLRSLGIDNPERFFPGDVQERFNRPRGDYDFRAQTTVQFAVNFLQVGNDFENMLKGKLRKSKLDWVPYVHFNNKENISLNLRMNVFEFVFFNKLKSQFLYGHRSIEIPCKAVLHEEESLPELFPESREIHLLQSLMDELLQRLDPYSDLNPQGNVRQAFAITEGYSIWEQSIWERISGRKINLGKQETLGTHLQKMVEKINQGHPALHPAGDYFNAMNVVSLFGENMTATDSKAFWSPYENGVTLISIHPSLGIIHSLLTTEQEGIQKLPRALLALSGLLQQFIVFDSSVSARMMYAGADKKCGIVLQYATNMGAPLHLQMQVDFTQAYQQFVILCLKLKDLSPVEQFLRNMCSGTSVAIREVWKPLKMNWKELRQSVLKQRHQQVPAIKTINFYLLLVLHLLEPIPATENAILEMIPNIEMEKESLQILLTHCLGDGYSKAYQRYNDLRAEDPDQYPIKAWLSVLFQKMNSAKAAKMAQVLPRFQKQLPDSDYRELLKSHLLSLRENYPQQAVSLLISAMEGFKPLNLYCYELYFKVLFPFLNPFYHNIIANRIVELGLILERLCQDNIQWATHTIKREYVFLHIVSSLLALEDNTLGKRIVAAIHDGHPFQLIFQKHLPILRQMAFPVQVTASNEILPLEFQRMTDAVTQTLKGRDLQRTKKPLLAIFDALFDKSLTPHLEKLLNEVWEKGKIALQSGVAGTISVLFEISSSPKIHDIFPKKCLEMHMEIIACISKLPKPLFVSTNRDFLLISLQMFYSRVPLDRKFEYCQGLVHLTHQIWSPSEPIGLTLLNHLSIYALDIIRTLAQSPVVGVTFLIQSHIYDVPLHWEKMKIADLSPLIEFALSDEKFTSQQKAGIIKIADNYSKTTSQLFPENIVYRICQYAISFLSADKALEWYSRLAEVSTDSKLFVEIIPLLLMKLHAIKKFTPISQILTHYREHDGVPENIDFLWTDLFITSQANALLRLMMQFHEDTLFHVSIEEDRRRLHILCQALDLSSSSIMEVKTALLLLVQARIMDHHVWIRVLHEISRKDVAPLKQLAFDILLQELRELHLLDGTETARFECWKVMMTQLTFYDLSEETALKLIEIPQQLNLTFQSMGSEAYRSLAPSLIETLYAKLQRIMNSDICDRLCAFHGVFCKTMLLEKFFEVDIALLKCVNKWINDYNYCSIYDNVIYRLQNYPALQESNTAILLLHKLSTLTVNSAPCNNLHTQFIQTVCGTFNNTPWIIRFLCALFTNPISEHHQLAKVHIDDFFSQIALTRQSTYLNYFEDHRTMILNALINLVKTKGSLASTVGILSDIVYNPHVSSYLKSDHTVLIAEFMDCLFADSAVITDENPKLDEKYKMGYIKLMFFVFEKHVENMSELSRERLSMGLLDLVNNMIEKHQNYPDGCNFVQKILHNISPNPFYYSLETYLKRAFKKEWVIKPETPIQLAYELIKDAMDADFLAKGKDFGHVMRLLDLFVFSYDFVGDVSVFGKCVDAFRNLSYTLIQQAQTFYSVNLSFELPIHYSLDKSRGLISMMMKYATCKSLVCHVLLLDMFDSHARFVWEDPTQAVKIVGLLYENHLKYPFKRHFGSYFIRTTNQCVSKMVGASLKMQDSDYQHAAESIITIMIDVNTKFIQMVQTLPAYLVEDFDIYIRMLFFLAQNGAFNKDPNYYWLLASKHLKVLNDFVTKSQTQFSRYLLYGLMLVDPGIWSKPHTLSAESESRKVLIYQTLITKQLHRLTDQVEVRQTIQMIESENWAGALSAQSDLPSVVKQLNIRAKLTTFQNKTKQKALSGSCSKSRLWIKKG